MHQSTYEVEKLAQIHHAELLKQAEIERSLNAGKRRKTRMRPFLWAFTRGMDQPTYSETT